jgi:hypothetical protein
MEPLARNLPVNSSARAETIDWPIMIYWLTYLSIVFGILYAFISDGL